MSSSKLIQSYADTIKVTLCFFFVLKSLWYLTNKLMTIKFENMYFTDVPSEGKLNIYS